MNLFLLVSVPLAAVALHLFLYSERREFSIRPWIEGAVWALASLVVVSFFGKGREFSGDLGLAFLGLTFTDALVVPGVVIGAWVFFRRGQDPWELALWLALVFTFAGIRDFAATDRLYDLNELFLVPLDRILLLVAVPPVVGWTRAGTLPLPLRIGALVALVATGSLVPVLSFAGWGWVDWVLVPGATAATLWFLKTKKAAPQGSGLVS